MTSSIGRLFAMFIACFLPVMAFAEVQSGDALGWLQKAYAATHKLSYTGVFVYQQGGAVETSRITRIVEGGVARERLEAMDGMPREVLREGDDVVCYMPATMTMRIDKQAAQRNFPGILPAQIRELADIYTIRKGDVERVAGYDCQVLLLDPKDNMRYGHKLCADSASGMLLKARTFDEKGLTVEQFNFTQLQIGGQIDRDRVKSRFSAKGRDWKVEDSRATEANLAGQGWTVRTQPPGFHKLTEMTRSLGGVAGVGHIVLSDGLAAVSVFIEPSSGKPTVSGLARQGAINVYIRQVGNHRITVVGETPPESVRFIANAVEFRRPQ